MDERRAMLLMVRGQLAREEDLEGFKSYYWCIQKRELPDFQVPWFVAAEAAWKRARAGEISGLLNEAARGYTKSTFDNTFVSWKMGLHPILSHVIVQDTDKASKRTSEYFADLISKSAGWKACFPTVVPDYERGWNLDGYHIKDADMDYAQFIQKTMTDHGRDPSFMAVSVTGGAIGSHPTGCLVLDDICNEENTASAVESAKITKKVQAEILPTMSRMGAKPMLIVAFTPWTLTDVYAMLKATGKFTHIFTPAFVEDSTSEIEWFGGGKDRSLRVRLTWEGKTIEELRDWRVILGAREFKRMYLLDLTVDPGDSQYYVTFPEDRIDISWPMGGGVDPSDTNKENTSDLRKQSSFALAYGAKRPAGGIVLVDGVVEQCSIATGVQHILRAQGMFPRWVTTIVESVGYGRTWFNQAALTPGLMIRAGDLKGFGFTERKAVNNRDKADRLQKELFPLLDNGILVLSSRRSPFMDAARKLLQEFYTLDAHDPAWDVWDAIYQMVKGFPEALQAPAVGEVLSGHKPKHRNPLIPMTNTSMK